MGEIADMMLDGTLCEQCGVYIDDELGSPGYPRLCPACEQQNKRVTMKAKKTGSGRRRHKKRKPKRGSQKR